MLLLLPLQIINSVDVADVVDEFPGTNALERLLKSESAVVQAQMYLFSAAQRSRKWVSNMLYGDL